MRKLKALTSILYLSKLYLPGEELPTNNASMVDAWISAGTAVWTEGEQNIEAPKARLVTRESGLAGEAIGSESEDGENLVGKVPKTNSRKRK